MTPQELVGKNTWQALQQGALLSGTTRRGFKTQQVRSRLGRLIQMINPLRLFRPERVSAKAITRLHKRAVSQVSGDKVDNLVTLKMAAAGMVDIRAVQAGKIIARPAALLSLGHIQNFCELSSSPRQLISRIRDSRTRQALQELYSKELLEEHRGIAEYWIAKDLPPVDHQAPAQSSYLRDVPHSVQECLYDLVEEHTLTDLVYWANSESRRAKEIIRGQVDEQKKSLEDVRFNACMGKLLISAHLAKAGLIPARELEMSYKDFLANLNGNQVLSNHIAKDFLHCSDEDAGKELQKLSQTRMRGDLHAKHPWLVNEEPLNSELRRLAETNYEPQLEQADRTPGLKNYGNTCYYNSMIKLVANQFSMEDLNEFDRLPREITTSEKKDSQEALQQRQELATSLVSLLRSIKLCRAGMAKQEHVDSLNKAFQDKLRASDDDPLIKSMFARASQEDAHEFTQVINKLLNHGRNPDYSFNMRKTRQLHFGGGLYTHVVGTGNETREEERDTVLLAVVEKGKSATPEDCLARTLKPEEINYFWEDGDVEEMGLDPVEIRDLHKEHQEEIEEMLELYKQQVKDEGMSADFAGCVERMTFDADTGYFNYTVPDRKEDGTPYMKPKTAVIPPWAITVYQDSYEADPKKLDSLMMAPKIFRRERGQVKKLAEEGSAFFEGLKDSVEIPVLNPETSKSETVTMAVKGMSCHRGDSAGNGHYVYIEKTDDGWLVNDDKTLLKLDDEQALKDYLGSQTTPYVYHLENTNKPAPVVKKPVRPIAPTTNLRSRPR